MYPALTSPAKEPVFPPPLPPLIRVFGNGISENPDANFGNSPDCAHTFLGAPASSWRAIPVVLRWLCGELVRALLHGAWAQVCLRQGGAYDRAFDRFTALVEAAPCWPCRVEWSHRTALLSSGGKLPGLSIWDQADGFDDDDFEEGERTW